MHAKGDRSPQYTLKSNMDIIFLVLKWPESAAFQLNFGALMGAQMCVRAADHDMTLIHTSSVTERESAF